MRYLGLTLLLIIHLLLAKQIAAQCIISGSVTGNGGSPISNNQYQLMSTIGQSVTGMSECNDYFCGVGFWCLAKKSQLPIYVNEADTPKQFILRGNYPNPFNPSTTIRFELPKQSNVRLRIFSTSGQLVTTLIDSCYPEGIHTVQWKPEGLSGGVYFYTIESGLGRKSGKMLLLK